MTDERVTVQFTVFDPTNTKDFASLPGSDFLAIDPANPSGGERVGIDPVIFMNVSLLGSAGGEYHHLLSSLPATLEMAIPDALQGKYDIGQKIPFWMYDETIGLWRRKANDGEVFQNNSDNNRKWLSVKAEALQPNRRFKSKLHHLVA